MKKTSLQQQKEELLAIVQNNCMQIGVLFLYDEDKQEEITQLVMENKELSRKVNSIMMEIDLVGKE